MRAPCALWLAAVLGAVAAPVAALDLLPPRYTREQMESALDPPQRWLFVYGTQGPATRRLRERALMIARRLFGRDSAAVRADDAVSDAELARHSVCLLGSPAENAWTRRLAPALPVTFTPGGFTWAGREYSRPGDVIHLVYPNPCAPRRFLLLLAGNSSGAIGRHGGGFYFGGEDWRITRDGELVRSGRFAQPLAHPWSYDPALDRDRERERQRFEAALLRSGNGALVVRAPAGLSIAAATRAAGEALLSRLDVLGLRARGGKPMSLTLYPSLEQKGVLARNTRPEHLEADGGAGAALPAGREALDLWCLAAMRLLRLGASPRSPWLEPACAWLAARLEGEPLECAVSRLYFGRALPTAGEAAARGAAWRSPLVLVPARALLARAIFESAAGRGPAALLAILGPEPPGSLDSLCRVAGVESGRVARRFAQLADSLARAGQRGVAERHPRAWRPADGFQRGVCLAHAVSLEEGYLSGACGRELATLRRMGASWISLSPFGYLPDTNTPVIYPSAEGGVDGETDEAVCEAAARARGLGLRVWLSPHLWTRGWVGELDFGAAGWPRFFEQYRNFILHYALLAERERMDGLMVGHELPSASLPFPDRWRALIGEVRRIYDGTLTYAANWDREVAGIRFWDALDLVGVSFYVPLSARETRDLRQLRGGAAKALAGLRAIAARTGRPVLLAEVGYAPTPGAPVQPWQEHAGPPDMETQRACYQAVVQALDPEVWVAGALWWKWFTTDAIGGPGDASFTPRGKPAQGVLEQALRQWQGRPVRVLSAAGH